MGIFDQVRKTLSDAKAKLGVLRGEIEEAKKRRNDLLTLPLPFEDFCDFICELVDRHAQQYTRDLGAYFEKVTQPQSWHLENYEIGKVSLNILAAHPAAYGRALAEIQGTQATSAALCWIFGDVIKERVRLALIAADIKWPDIVGPTRAMRKTEIAKLDERIASMAAQETFLSDEIRSIGDASGSLS